MKNESPLIRALTEYYDGKKILSTNFDCEHECKCRGNLSLTPNGATTSEKILGTFTQAKSAFVGIGYENARELGIPRLMFVTSDPGSAIYPGRNWVPRENRTPEAVRNIRSKTDLNSAGNVGKSMHEIARQTLGQYNSDIASTKDAAIFFTNVNAAKCCQNKPQNAEGNRIFKKCQEYLRGEINTLAPNIIVALGLWAKRGMEVAFMKDAEAAEWGRGQEFVLDGQKRGLWIPIMQRHRREARKNIARQVREFFPIRAK